MHGEHLALKLLIVGLHVLLLAHLIAREIGGEGVVIQILYACVYSLLHLLVEAIVICHHEACTVVVKIESVACEEEGVVGAESLLVGEAVEVVVNHLEALCLLTLLHKIERIVVDEVWGALALGIQLLHTLRRMVGIEPRLYLGYEIVGRH